MSLHVAFDLGTSNTTAAVVWRERARLVPLRNRATFMPSAVAIDGEGRWRVGREAKAQLFSRPADTIVGLKALLGREMNTTSFRLAAEGMPYKIIAEGGRPHAQVGNSAVGLVEIAAMLLHEVRDQVQSTLQQKVESAVLPVPDFFNPGQREAIAAAARTSGVNNARVVEESEAITALVECAGRAEKARLVFLYGLGGGAFTATVLERTAAGRYETIATSGEELGGVQFDRSLARFLYKRFLETEEGIEVKDPIGLQRILEAAEAAKIALDYANQTPVRIPCLIMDPNAQPIELGDQLDREMLIETTGDLVRRTLRICQSALRAAHVDRRDIDACFLYGRSCASREVHAATSRFFEATPVRLPEGAPALGAAILASRSSV